MPSITTIPHELRLYEDGFNRQLVDVWERSVRATHTFLDPDDIDYFRSIVEKIDFHMLPVYCLIIEDRVAGFLGVDEGKLEMLFLDPDYIGKGLGKRMMDYALNELRADRVDVNEQNAAAVSFYRQFGFVPYERHETDSQGKPYPVLRMKLANAQEGVVS